ncbi:hypothetical protein AAGG74_15280 [Bacillus mexicanus]|uniref:hypothetical protein n=1 Tax=Bacillus mexicanus TaxID=2834415 RepID=UPI003D208918
MIKWARVGMSIDVNEELWEKDKEEAVMDAFRKGKVEMDGETYFPDEVDENDDTEVNLDLTGVVKLMETEQQPLKKQTDLEKVIGKELSKTLSNNTELKIKVLNEKEVQYRFIEGNGDTKNEPITTILEVAEDDVEGLIDFSFMDELTSTRFFLFQFSLVK